MSFLSASTELKNKKPGIKIYEFSSSSATVEEAAAVLEVAPQRIAKTLAFKVGEEAILVVAAGDAKIDNAKYKKTFGTKAKMLSSEELMHFTSHPVGGVCPFGLSQPLKVYLDVSLKRFETVYPACGSSNSAIELSCEELEAFIDNVQWTDICKGWQEDHNE